MDTSVFLEKEKAPGSNDLQIALGKQFELWNELKEYVYKKCTDTVEEWSFSKFGWNYRIKDSKRAIIYFMPCDNYFKVSFVFGNKAAEVAVTSGISKDIQNIISSAKVYAEGRGFRIDVKNKKIIRDIKKLIKIKLSSSG